MNMNLLSLLLDLLNHAEIAEKIDHSSIKIEREHQRLSVNISD